MLRLQTRAILSHSLIGSTGVLGSLCGSPTRPCVKICFLSPCTSLLKLCCALHLVDCGVHCTPCLCDAGEVACCRFRDTNSTTCSFCVKCPSWA